MHAFYIKHRDDVHVEKDHGRYTGTANVRVADHSKGGCQITRFHAKNALK